MTHIFLTGHPAVGKTTIVKSVLKSIENNAAVYTKGFYTEECRSKGGERIGFDIVYYLPSGAEDRKPRRESLSRLKDKMKKSDPHVGKYLVNTDNIEKYAIASINLSSGTAETDKNELVIIDEVGKMEMLCPSFLPAVNRLLDSNFNSRKESCGDKRIILGTIPTPRYGRVLQAVEDIRARDDIIVLHVTKANRDNLKQVLRNAIGATFSNENRESEVQKSLEPFVYTRPIGASSLDGNGKMKAKSATNECTEIINDFINEPCGPLYMDNVEKKILLLGETASPQPSNPKHSYCERSMWIVLGRLSLMDFKPIKNVNDASASDLQKYGNLQSKILSKGICIWDVLADVHDKKVRRGKNKRQRKTNNFNDINKFLKENPSIQMVGFIGQKARKTFEHCESLSVDLVTLSSSSPANSRITVDEKASEWKSVFLKYIPDLGDHDFE